MYIVNPKEIIKTLTKNIAIKPMVEVTQHYKNSPYKKRQIQKKKQRIDIKNRKQIAK